jgi:4-amino-4-deoxy-L-arabinose transferase-like glycosyltransferase
MIVGKAVTGSSKAPLPARWSVAFLLLILVGDVWYRAHTLAPILINATGVTLWPAARGPSEPLDCDEAAYAYIGHRLLEGDVMYRDLTENKPPLGYWLYALAVAAGGYNEVAIRLLPIPSVILTASLICWIGSHLASGAAGCLAAALYALLSTDPYLFGNGSNMEHFMNLFSVASLALVILGWNHPRRWPIVAAGACLGAAALVKQVAILPLVVYALGLVLHKRQGHEQKHRGWKTRLGDVMGLGVGLSLVVGPVVGILLAQGAGAAAYEDIMQYGRALATDTLPEPGAPPGLIRWLTGNADPAGKLPWPFGSTGYLVWWGTGSWPLWLVAVPCLLHLLKGRGATAERRMAAGWLIAAALQVVLPGLYWQHYYLLPAPGVALVVAIVLWDCLAIASAGWERPGKTVQGRLGSIAVALASSLVLSLAIGGTLVKQVSAYLLVPPQELTIRYKGGGQWVALRSLGHELARRSKVWSDPHLYVWGWQSPLHFYGKLDGVTRHFFVDNLLRDQAERDHPLIKPRIDEIMRALHDRPPALIFVGYAPFPALREFLLEHYLPSRMVPTRNGLGLWVDREHFAAFENFAAAGGTPGSMAGRGLDR